MKIGTTTDVLTVNGDEHEAIRTAAALGYTALDYTYFAHDKDDSVYLSDNWEDYARSLRKTADACGISFSQMHAPMPAPIGAEPNEERVRKLTERGFFVAEILGANVFVIHARHTRESAMGMPDEAARIAALREYESYLPFAKQTGVKIGVENLFACDPFTKRLCKSHCSTPEEVLWFLEKLGREHATACLDTGHANIIGISCADFVSSLHDALGCLHVHDNHALLDEHIAPFGGTIHWDEFIDALRRVGYNGAFSYEAFGAFSNQMSFAQRKTTASYLLHTANNLLLSD
ncbi:sugar phosphate isomerase/epimerase [Phocea massiliensis]|uniref:Sugar phosphate isomerase/epimerase n=1 Tax=Merdimmobilis hominis TaxID=2897707 RepID=A0A938X519_9FIRM|nr:sugar phosphate isomerase/epimerase [Merdimmobilis hominis]MBM6920356.1 sugar phosphate isomerase/epimerase [Merdimmobilis hominis]